MASRISVLIADDDCGHRETLVELLRDRGMEAHAAETGNRALAIARTTVIHAGILDVHMPGLTGIETCRRIRGLVGRLPLILMSGAATEGMRHDALDAGAASFLEKPLDLRVLMETLTGLVRVHLELDPPSPRLRRASAHYRFISSVEGEVRDGDEDHPPE